MCCVTQAMAGWGFAVWRVLGKQQSALALSALLGEIGCVRRPVSERRVACVGRREVE